MYFSSDFLANLGLSNTQIDKIKEHIDYNYGILYDTYIHDVKVQPINKYSFFVSMYVEVEDGYSIILDPHTILVDGSGCCTEMEYPIINYINQDLILMTKETEIIIENLDNPEYYKKYFTIEKQAIMNNKGNILYEGELGDINKARLINHYLLLEKDKYTDLQKEQIYYYYYHQIFGDHLSEEEELNKLAESDFSEVFNSEEIKLGKFIIDTPEEREEREMYEDLINQYEEERFDHELEPDYVEPYINGKLYSVYDVWRRKLLFPFQPCKISAFPEGMPKGIYLANEEDHKTTYCGFLYDSKVKSYPWSLVPDPFGNMSRMWMPFFEGPMFFTVYDTFRTGPHTGLSFLQVYRKEASKIEKYILSDHMYMTTDLLKELKDIEHVVDNNRAFSILLATRDSKLTFMPINDIKDEMRGYGAYPSCHRLLNMYFLTSWYEKMTFVDVFKKDPQYVISLIELNDINIDDSVLDELEKYDRIQELRDCLQSKFEKQKREYDDYYDYMREEEERRYYENEGYQDAYDGNPDAQWNTE